MIKKRDQIEILKIQKKRKKQNGYQLKTIIIKIRHILCQMKILEKNGKNLMKNMQNIY